MQRTLNKLKNREPVVISVVGDSNNIVCFNTQGRMNWVGYLTEALWYTYGDDLVTMINNSRCGYDYRECLKELDRRVLRWKPDLVIFGLGINDSRHGKEGLEESKQVLRDVINEIRGKCGAEILLRTPNPVVYGYWDPLPAGAKVGEPYEGHIYACAEFAKAMVEVAGEMGCAVCDHYSAWKAKRYVFHHPPANPQGLRMRMGDTIHPNAVGQLAFFRELAPLFGVSKYFPWEEVDEHC